MRTTTRSSERVGARGCGLGSPRRSLPAALLLLAIPALGCVSPTPAETFFQLTPESAAHKAAQTRWFETPDERELLSASAAVLQDLGFQVSESERLVGFLRATKERSAREYGQEIMRSLIFLASTAGVVFGANTLTLVPVDLHQQINAALVTRPVEAGSRRHEVRIQFYRIVWKGDGNSGDQYIQPGQQKMEMIRDPETYQQFFARLAKAVFLEAHRI